MARVNRTVFGGYKTYAYENSTEALLTTGRTITETKNMVFQDGWAVLGNYGIRL